MNKRQPAYVVLYALRRTMTLALLLCVAYQAVATDRFVATVALPTGQTAVIAEGDLEARSIGSFSVRLYEAAGVADQTTFFIAGLVRARDGVVERVRLADIDDDDHPEIIVITRSAGTGAYQSAHAFAFTAQHLAFRQAVENLGPHEDPVSALRNSSNSDQ